MSRFGAHFEISYSILAVIYQKWSFSWTINKMGSEVEKLYELTLGSGELFWELILKFHIKYWLCCVWYIIIDRFHGLFIKWVQTQKKSYGLIFGSSEPFGEFISELCMRYSLWYIKADRFYKPSIIHWGSVSKISVLGIICCNCPHRFTSGSLYTSYLKNFGKSNKIW